MADPGAQVGHNSYRIVSQPLDRVPGMTRGRVGSRRRPGVESRGGAAGDPAWSRAAVCYPRACTFAQVSFRVIVRLNTGAPGAESVSAQK